MRQDAEGFILHRRFFRCLTFSVYLEQTCRRRSRWICSAGTPRTHGVTHTPIRIKLRFNSSIHPLQLPWIVSSAKFGFLSMQLWCKAPAPPRAQKNTLSASFLKMHKKMQFLGVFRLFVATTCPKQIISEMWAWIDCWCTPCWHRDCLLRGLVRIQSSFSLACAHLITHYTAIFVWKYAYSKHMWRE